MIGEPYFMKNKDWYSIDENGNYVLTKLAPQEAIDDYNKLKQEYLQQQKELEKKGIDAYLTIREDDWLQFPL